MPNTLKAEVLPSGGLVKLYLGSTDILGAWTLTRADTSGNTYALYTGAALEVPLWLDLGDGLNGPLDPSVVYTYTFSTTNAGSVSTSAQPVCTIEVNYDDYLRLFVRLLQAGVQSLSLPNGSTFRNKPQVMISMPLTGTPALPILTINEDLMQQDQVPIGHGMQFPTAQNDYQIDELVMRRYRITILTQSTDEREFWKFAVISLVKTILIPVLETMGQDVTSRFQAASSQMTDVSPGFYFCDIMIEFTGVLPVRIQTNYGTFALTTDFAVEANGTNV